MDKQLPLLMKVGMVILLVGGVAFLAMSVKHSGTTVLIASAASWGLGAGTCIFSSAIGEIKRLNQRIAELESPAE